MHILRLLISAMVFIPHFAWAKQVEIQAHRGVRSLYPENSLPAFQAAIDAQVDGIELDLQMTKDGELIIHHDYFLPPSLCSHQDGREISQKHLICKMNLAEIKQFDCGRKTNPHFPLQASIPHTLIPTLKELFALIRDSAHPHSKIMKINLEIKRNPAHPEYSFPAAILAEKVSRLVQATRLPNPIYYSSFDPEVLAELRKREPNALIGLIYDDESLLFAKKLYPQDPLAELLKVAQSLQVQIVSPEHFLIPDANAVDQLHQMGFRVIPWTINNRLHFQELIDRGVDGIISDYPQNLLRR